jgi:hypothetical protein
MFLSRFSETQSGSRYRVPSELSLRLHPLGVRERFPKDATGCVQLNSFIAPSHAEVSYFVSARICKVLMARYTFSCDFGLSLS